MGQLEQMEILACPDQLKTERFHLHLIYVILALDASDLTDFGSNKLDNFRLNG